MCRIGNRDADIAADGRIGLAGLLLAGLDGWSDRQPASTDPAAIGFGLPGRMRVDIRNSQVSSLGINVRALYSIPIGSNFGIL
jgi:hypothetical protein